MKETKQYNDEIYGSIQLNALQVRLAEAADVSQTNHISQLGLVQETFAAAEHTRLIHNIGASILASQFAQSLKLGETERLTLEAAAILHDIGHTPFSHAAAEYFKEKWGYTQEKLSSEKILRDGEIKNTLHEHDLNPQTVADLIFEKKFTEKYQLRQRYLKQLIAGDMDVDRIDFLLRDALRTAPFGKGVDYKRLIQSAKRVDHREFGDIVVYDEDCLAAVESFFYDYFSMYKAVYYNPNVKADETFLNKALFLAHDFLYEKFSQFRNDPSKIREDDIIKTLRSIPSDEKKHLVAKEIIDCIFDKKKKFESVASLLMGYQSDMEILKKIYEKFPYDGHGQDPLEDHLIKNIEGANEGEILVIRNIKKINGPKSAKSRDVFLKLRESGFRKGQIVSVNELVDFSSFVKELRHRHAFRVLTIREVYHDKILEILKAI